jgi:uncharacterized damage-inducible protein DinB
MSTRSSDPLDILLKHDRWATRRVLEACVPLPPEQFSRRFDIGPGSLHDTITHVIAAMRRWHDRLAEVRLRPSIDRPLAGGLPGDVGYTLRTPADLLELHEAAAEEFAACAAACIAPGGRCLASVIHVEFDGKPYTFTRGAVLVHVATHGMHHRAQCLNMLRQLGVYPVIDLPEIAVVDWQAEVQTGQLTPWRPPA